MNAYQQLEVHMQRHYHFEHLAAITSWDEAVMMPAGGGPARAQALATLRTVQHAWLTDPKVDDLIHRAKQINDLSAWQHANLLLIERLYRHAIAIPAELVEKVTQTSFICTQAWRELRPKNDWKNFKPLLKDLFQIVKTIADIKAAIFSKSSYDVLIDEYSPNMDTTIIDPIFKLLKDQLPEIIQKAVTQQKSRPIQPISGTFITEQQKALSTYLMSNIGFNFNHGRLDESHHPFCGGISQDVRITTRYNQNDFMSALMAVCHETGHGLYEQGLPLDWQTQPVGHSSSMAVHESQSLLIEMQICRSREYLQYLTPLVQKYFPDAKGITFENLYYHYTQVKPGFIRVDADELTYPLHVIMRYEIEQQLFSNMIEIDDLPEIWDNYMQKYLGLSTKENYKDGLMQDVHWSLAAFGYFPSYTIGAVIAAQLFAAAKKVIPNLHEQISQCEFSSLVNWLRNNVHQKASSISFQEILCSATGETLNPQYYLNHINARYLD